MRYKQEPAGISKPWTRLTLKCLVPTSGGLSKENLEAPPRTFQNPRTSRCPWVAISLGLRQTWRAQSWPNQPTPSHALGAVRARPKAKQLMDGQRQAVPSNRGVTCYGIHKDWPPREGLLVGSACAASEGGAF